MLALPRAVRIGLLVSALAVIGRTHAVAAQSTEVTPVLDANIGAVLYISVSNGNITFQPNLSDLKNGSIVSPVVPAVAHAGNVRHSVRIGAASSNMSATDPTHVKPASDVQWSNNSGTTWTPFPTPADLATDAPRGMYVIPLMLRALVGLSDAADTYTLNITFTIIAT